MEILMHLLELTTGHGESVDAVGCQSFIRKVFTQPVMGVRNHKQAKNEKI
jgi:hypothetical protein